MAKAADQGLFDELAPRPLADRLRPASLDEVVGQDHLLGEDGALTRLLKAGQLASIVFWGPPGCGKTTIARLLADAVDLAFEPLSAVFSGVAGLRKVFARAQERRAGGQGTFCSSTKFIGLIGRSRTGSYPMSRTARSCWWARRRKTRASN